MSTDKSLKHLKSKAKFLIANVSNDFGLTAHHIQQTVQATGASRKTVF